jgi:hypothetical protein
MATGGFANLAKQLIKKVVPEATEKVYRAFSNTTSTPMSVDVSAEGMKKQSKKLSKGTGVTYSGIKTSSQGLLVGANTEKKTLLGG